MADIFVSYRRGDSAGHTGRLVDSLERHFGRQAVFQDVQSIGAGRRWDEVIRDGVSSCRVLVAVIGRDWLAADQGGRRRIDDPQDHLRREVVTALEREVPVVPVLVEGARMPVEAELPDDLKPLVRWQAHELSDSRWEYDTGRLMSMIASAAAIVPQQQVAPRPRRIKPVHAGAAAALVIAGAVWLLWPDADVIPELPPDAAPSVPDGGAHADSGAVAVAPASFEGNWYDEDAADWGIRVDQDKVEINHTAAGTGTAIGYGQGTISDRSISFEYVVMVPDEPRLSGQLVLSDDGQRLTGVLTDLKNGGTTRILLHRRSS